MIELYKIFKYTGVMVSQINFLNNGLYTGKFC